MVTQLPELMAAESAAVDPKRHEIRDRRRGRLLRALDHRRLAANEACGVMPLLLPLPNNLVQLCRGVMCRGINALPRAPKTEGLTP